MPCEVCGCHPTWADLAECGDMNCPWTLDVGKPIPPLTPEMMRSPEFSRITPAAPMSAPKPVADKVPAVVSTAAPQPHSWDEKVEKLVEGMEPPASNPAPVEPSASVTTTDAPETERASKISWAEMIAKNKDAPAPTAPKKPVATAAPAQPARPARSLSSSTQANDFDTIMHYIDEVMVWEGRYGPSCRITTKIDWNLRECRELYLYVKDQLHDRPFYVGKKRLYFYVGAIGNWGKAGFRISGHTKPVAKIKNSATCGVLHIEN
ncbi:MAG: hypothetical protein AAFV19_20275 [Pseudomonadota bacterium]